MALSGFPLVWRGDEQSGFLVQAITAINRSIFTRLEHPPARGPFLCVIPVGDFWRLLLRECDRTGVQHFSSTVDEPLLQALREDRARLIFDLSNEGPDYHTEIFAELHRWVSDSRIPPRQVAFVSQNRALAARHRDVTGDFDLQFLTFDAFIVDAYLNALRLAASSQSAPDRGQPHATTPPFVCLNYSPRPHRVCLLLALLRDGRIDRGLVSFPGVETEKHSLTDADLPLIAELGCRLPGLLEFLPELRRRGRMVVDDYEQGGNALASRLDPQIHASAYTVIVTESDFSSGGIRRITEKSIKPLFAERPFIVLGNPYSLALIRELGFQTFQPLIDEAYDDAADPALRMLLVDHEISRIASRSPPSLRALALQSREICQYNRRLLVNGGAIARYWDVHVAPLLRWLRQPID